jgi:hypothetical protein
MRKWITIIWCKYLEWFWNWIPAGIQSIFYNKTRGKGIFRELRSLAPDVHKIEVEMGARKFEWRADPIVDFHQKTWVTCDRGAGDCDDWAHLWKDLLKDHGETRLLFTKRKSGGAHAMCIFIADGKAYLLSNLIVRNKVDAENADELMTKFYGEETEFSFYM